MIRFILRLYLRRGARLTVKRIKGEIDTVYSKNDTLRYTGMALDDFFCRASRSMRNHMTGDVRQIIEEEKQRARNKYASF